MGEIDVGQSMASREESFQAWIELALDPERPDPIAVRLDRQRVQQPPQVHPHSDTNEVLGNAEGPTPPIFVAASKSRRLSGSS